MDTGYLISETKNTINVEIVQFSAQTWLQFEPWLLFRNHHYIKYLQKC
jgi:hypothetical protein